MRVSEYQLLVLLSVAEQALDGTLETELEDDSVRQALRRLYDEIMAQQNEIVDTSNFPNPTRDQYLRLVFDMFESLKVTAEDPKDFYESPMGKRALAIMYPDRKKPPGKENNDAKEE